MTNYTKRTIKNAILTIAVLAGIVICLGFAGNCDYLEEQGWVERKGILCEDAFGQYLVTKDGNVWDVTDFTYSNGKPVEVGDKVKVYFDTNGTADADDDSIKEVYKARFIF